jgi:hypothetical protein
MFIIVDTVIYLVDHSIEDEEIRSLTTQEVGYTKALIAIKDISYAYQKKDNDHCQIIFNNGHVIEIKETVNEVIEKINKASLLQKIQ